MTNVLNKVTDLFTLQVIQANYKTQICKQIKHKLKYLKLLDCKNAHNTN